MRKAACFDEEEDECSGSDSTPAREHAATPPMERKHTWGKFAQRPRDQSKLKGMLVHAHAFFPPTPFNCCAEPVLQLMRSHERSHQTC
jgi:hypothetical protein